MSAGKLAMVIFEARTAAHIMHLKTRSYAQHVALNGFYDGIIDLVDAYLEAYQGVYGLIEDYPDAEEFEKETDPLKLMNALRKFLTSNRAGCCKDQTELENLYDGLIDLVDSTRYKLRFLA